MGRAGRFLEVLSGNAQLSAALKREIELRRREIISASEFEQSMGEILVDFRKSQIEREPPEPPGEFAVGP